MSKARSKEPDSADDSIPQDETDRLTLLSIKMVQALAEGGRPVSAKRAAAFSGLPVDYMAGIFEQAQAVGSGEFDEEGRLLGNAVTLVPTKHRFRVNGNDLYVWCSFDALFHPILLRKTAHVVSTDPVSGESIRLTVTPEGVTEVTPAGTVVSVFLEGARDRPQSEACRLMHFFGSIETAEEWKKEHPKAEILTVEDAHQSARVGVDQFASRVRRWL